MRAFINKNNAWPTGGAGVADFAVREVVELEQPHDLVDERGALHAAARMGLRAHPGTSLSTHTSMCAGTYARVRVRARVRPCVGERERVCVCVRLCACVRVNLCARACVRESVYGQHRQ